MRLEFSQTKIIPSIYNSSKTSIFERSCFKLGWKTFRLRLFPRILLVLVGNEAKTRDPSEMLYAVCNSFIMSEDAESNKTHVLCNVPCSLTKLGQNFRSRSSSYSMLSEILTSRYALLQCGDHHFVLADTINRNFYQISGASVAIACGIIIFHSFLNGIASITFCAWHARIVPLLDQFRRQYAVKTRSLNLVLTREQIILKTENHAVTVLPPR